MSCRSFLVGLACGIVISVFFATAQEFIVNKKERKISVSCQQCVESLGEYEHIFADVMKELSRVFSRIADINGHIVGHIDKYVDGGQGGVQQLNKAQRAVFYTKMTSICAESTQMLGSLQLMNETLEKQLLVVTSL